MTPSEMWENNDPINDILCDVPRWIDQDISPYDVIAICQGGCASGAYMPAVTYHQALKTMDDYGDEIFDYLEGALGEKPMPDGDFSWSGLACFYVSCAVEIWASAIYDELEALEEVSQ